MTPAIGGFVAETRNEIETPDGATVRLRRQGRPSDLEYFVDVERNGEAVTLCKADPREVAQFWANLTAEIDDHGTGQQAKTDPWEFDEYGPDRRKPLPAGEAARQNWRIQLRKRGFSPNALIEEESHGGLPEYHIDDRRRPGRWEVERETLAEVESERDEPDPDRAHSTARAVADGGAEIVTDELPGNETVRLITGITRVMNAPRIVEGETSSTGKTISVDDETHGTHRLDAREIFDGETEFRDSLYFELYTPGRYRQRQRSNKAPGPRAGANEVTDSDELPNPTHWPNLETPDDAPDECPECGQTAAPWADRKRPRCEACGALAPDPGDDDAGEANAEGVAEAVPDEWDLSRLSRGDVLELAGHEDEFVITGISTFVGNDTVNYLEAAARDAGEWTEYTIQKVSPAGPKLKLTEDGPAVGIIVDDPDLIDDFEKVREDEEMLRDCIRQKFEQNAERVKGD